MWDFIKESELSNNSNNMSSVNIPETKTLFTWLYCKVTEAYN